MVFLAMRLLLDVVSCIVGGLGLGGGGEEVLGDVDGGYCHYAGDGDDEAFVAPDFYDVAFLVFEYAVEHSHFVAHRQVFVNHFQVAAPRFHGGSEHVDVALRDGAERLFAGHSVWPHLLAVLHFQRERLGAFHENHRWKQWFVLKCFIGGRVVRCVFELLAQCVVGFKAFALGYSLCLVGCAYRHSERVPLERLGC